MLLLACALDAAEPDPRVRPGASFVVEFPDLQVDRQGRPAQMEVRIPGDYRADGVYPLIAWMTGGGGNFRAGGADQLVDTSRFVRVGLPFPKGANNPRQGNMVGDFPTMWAYHRQMLAKLEELVPNIHPRMRIAAGFSNGARRSSCIAHSTTSVLTPAPWP